MAALQPPEHPRGEDFDLSNPASFVYTPLRMNENISMPNNEAADAAAALMGGAMGLVGLVIALAIAAVIIYFFANHAKSVPESYRRIQPNQVWLLLIPLFNFYWIFKVTAGISEGYKAALDAAGRGEGSDGGRKIGLWYSIAVVLSIIPCVNFVTGIAALVLLIMYFMQLGEAKKRLGVA